MIYQKTTDMVQIKKCTFEHMTKSYCTFSLSIGKMIIHMNLFQINPKQNLGQAFISINYIH